MKTNSFYFRGKKVNKSYVTIFANQGQFSLDAYFKNWLVVCYLKIITLSTVLLTINSTFYSLNGIKCNMNFLIYDIHDCINRAFVDVHTVDLTLTKMYIFSQDSLNMQVDEHINKLNDIPVLINMSFKFYVIVPNNSIV